MLNRILPVTANRDLRSPLPEARCCEYAVPVLLRPPVCSVETDRLVACAGILCLLGDFPPLEALEPARGDAVEEGVGATE